MMTQHEKYVLAQVLEMLASGKKLTPNAIKYELGVNGWETLMSILTDLKISIF